MSSCTDPQRGQLLHAYEMGWLLEDDSAAFEVHCLACTDCFEKVRAFHDGAEYLSTDPDAAIVVRHELAVADQRGSWLSRLWRHLWPDVPVILRPAVAYLAVLLLLPVAYQGLRPSSSAPLEVAGVRAVDLVAVRGSTAPVRISPGEDLVLRFAFGGARPGQTYRVVFESAGTVMFSDDQFTFNAQRVGYLRLPAALVIAGTYRLVIEDPRDTSALGVDTLRFDIVP